MTRILTLFFLLFLAENVLHAQPIIKLRTGNIINHSPEKNPANSSSLFSSSLYGGRHYLWLQFNAMPTEDIKKSIQETGVLLFSYLPDKTFIASFPEYYNYDLLKAYNVYAVTLPMASYKIDPQVLDISSIPWAVQQDSMMCVLISFMPTVSRNQLTNILVEENIVFTRLPDREGIELVVKASMGQLQRIAAHPLVHYIEPIGAPPVLEDIQSTSDHRTSLAATSDNWVTGRKLDGDGVVVAIGDDGTIGPHIDFTGRIGINASISNTTHGDHCAGIILGAGNLNPTVKGQAPAATLRAYDYYADFSALPAIYSTNNVRITTHSLGQTCNGGYTSDARTSDLQLRNYPSLMHVHSAGNSGADVCGGLTGGWRTITGGYKAGKNVIAVANLSKADVVSSSSSKGPLPDGRIKPDIAAVGSSVNSTQPNNTYASLSGTSMASPAIAGTLAVLYQSYKKQYGNEPNSGLIKAILMNTADDLGNAGPDFTYGFGRVNARRAIECIEGNRFFSASVGQGTTNNHAIQIPENVATAKIMVYWVDVEATAGANPSLVNNIDAYITTPSSTLARPWLMYAGTVPTVASCSAPAIKGIDTLNNVEQIQLDNPVSGTYQLKVEGADIAVGTPLYYVVVEYLYSNQIVVTHPFGGESFVPGEVQRIRWDATEKTGTFNIKYSANAGGTWTSVATGVSGSLRYYDWTVPSPTVTGLGRIMVERGSYNDVSDTNFVIVGVPTVTSFVSVCAGTSTVNWTPVTNATGYDVYKLGAKFMELVASTTNTNVTINNLGNTLNWIAVRAKLGTRQHGRRSIAVQHTNLSIASCSVPLQLIGFNAAKKNGLGELTWQTAQEQNLIKFVVERASIPSFDNLIVVGELPATNTSTIRNYQLMDRYIAVKGIYYYRLRIVERDRSIYSNIKSLEWESAANTISIYPNPATKNIHVQPQENFGAVAAELFNEAGAKVISFTWNMQIGKTETADISALPAGNYFLIIRSSKSGKTVAKQQVPILR